jgi:hypothetical protein
VNLPPTALPLSVDGAEDTQTEIVLLGTDPEGAPLAFEIIALPSAGTLAGTNNIYIYTPQTNYFGIDSFSYRVSDQRFASEPATVTLNITPRNDPPTIGSVSPQTVRKNGQVGPISIEVADVDRPISELLLFAQSSNPALVETNSIVFTAEGATRSVLVTPVSNVTGTAVITLTVSDGQLSNVTTFELTVTNTAPVAGGDEISTKAGTIVIPLATLLANDRDEDGDQLVIVSVSSPSALGRNVILSNEQIIYEGSYSSGEDSFIYTIEDSSHERSSAEVLLTLKSEPKIASVAVAEGEVTLNLAGEPDRMFSVWSSTDARTWSESGGGTMDSEGHAFYKEKIGSVERHRFFKIEWN